MATVLGELSSVKKALNELKDAVQSNAESIKRQRNRSNESSRRASERREPEPATLGSANAVPQASDTLHQLLSLQKGAKLKNLLGNLDEQLQNGAQTSAKPREQERLQAERVSRAMEANQGKSPIASPSRISSKSSCRSVGFRDEVLDDEAPSLPVAQSVGRSVSFRHDGSNQESATEAPAVSDEQMPTPPKGGGDISVRGVKEETDALAAAAFRGDASAPSTHPSATRSDRWSNQHEEELPRV